MAVLGRVNGAKADHPAAEHHGAADEPNRSCRPDGGVYRWSKRDAAIELPMEQEGNGDFRSNQHFLYDSARRTRGPPSIPATSSVLGDDEATFTMTVTSAINSATSMATALKVLPAPPPQAGDLRFQQVDAPY